MFWRRPIEVLVKRKVVGLTLLILALTAGTALAATVSGDGTLVGTTGNDTLNAGMGNDTLWGLSGSDTLNAGNGNDMIDAGGNCNTNDQGQDFPHGIPGTNQCSHGNGQGQQGDRDTVNAGNGNDTIYGGGGHNTINAGSGGDTIYGGPLGDTINLARGNSNDTINLCGTVNTGVACSISYSGSTVNLSSGAISGVVYANNGKKDTINCFGSPATVYADKIDTVNRCKHVVWLAAHAPAATHAKANALQAGAAGQALRGALRATR
jgi:Ca2+-binding RTX toxin-like protein